MKILIVGKGGREHCLAWKIKSSPLADKIFMAPGNPGMKNLGEIIDISENSIIELADFAEKEKIDLTVVGPESSLALGIVDEFEKRNLTIFGPNMKGAKIESSKDFTKKIMKKYNIPTAKYETFTDLEEAKKYVREKGVPIVIKEDGLRAGKGVTVATDLNQAMLALEEGLKKKGDKVVIEECLVGFEFSLIALVNGLEVYPLEIAQDHKRVGECDTGSNTGGMGIYSPVAKITKEIVDETMNKIMKPMAKAMVDEGIDFKGFLFGGIMLTSDGVKTIEFNVRFGDPEAQGILPRMKTDLIELILKVMKKEKIEIEWDKRVTLGVVMASENYPLAQTLNAEIEVDKNIESLIFHMGTKEENGKLLTNGGRVFTLLAFGDTLKEAKDKVYRDLNKIKCDKLFYRKDIGDKK